MIRCSHPGCESPARYSGASRTAAKPAPSFWYACEAHRDDLTGCDPVRELSDYEVLHHKLEPRTSEEE